MVAFFRLPSVNAPVEDSQKIAVRTTLGKYLWITVADLLTRAHTYLPSISDDGTDVEVDAQLTVIGGLTVVGHVKRNISAPLTAVGTNRATALSLAHDVNLITTAASGTGAQLPVGDIGMEIDVYVDPGIAADSIKVYADSAETIDGVAGATGVVLTKGKRARFSFVDTDAWVSAQWGAVSA
jgi:hypothetical protein